MKESILGSECPEESPRLFDETLLRVHVWPNSVGRIVHGVDRCALGTCVGGSTLLDRKLGIATRKPLTVLST